MRKLDYKSIEERPVPGKKEKKVTVQFTYKGSKLLTNGEPIVYKMHFPNLRAAEQSIQSAWEKDGIPPFPPRLISTEIL